MPTVLHSAVRHMRDERSEQRSRVGVVLVNYRTAALILELLRVWSDERTAGPHRIGSIVVVDNDPGQLDQLLSNPDVDYVALDRNRGYASGVNVGWRRTHESYVLLLNPDAKVPLESIDALANVLDSRSDVGAVAPLHLGPDEQVTNPYHTLPSWLDLIAHRTRLYRFAWAKRRVAAYFMSEVDRIDADWSPTEVEQPPASCLLVRRAAIKGPDLLDEHLPLLFNDVDLSRRLVIGRWRTLVVPSARCWHVPGTSGRFLGLRGTAENHIGAYRYARKWDGRFKAEILRGCLVGELMLTSSGSPDRREAITALISNRSRSTTHPQARTQ